MGPATRMPHASLWLQSGTKRSVKPAWCPQIGLPSRRARAKQSSLYGHRRASTPNSSSNRSTFGDVVSVYHSSSARIASVTPSSEIVLTTKVARTARA